VNDPKTLSSIEDAIRDIDSDLECFEEYGGLWCEWPSVKCEEIPSYSKWGNFTFQTKAS
jgi:hypothetical protein